MPRDVVFTFFHETWLSSQDRQFMPPDRLAPVLLESGCVDGALVVDPYRSGPLQLLRRLGGRPLPPAPKRPRTALARPYRLSRQDPVGAEALTRTYTAYDAAMAREVRKLGLERPALITTNPFVAAYGPAEWARSITYYAWDEWTALEGHGLERWWDDYHGAYAAMRDRDIRVCAVAPALLNTIAPRSHGLVLPNGVEPSEWSAPWTPPEWAGAIARPMALYIGSIHPRLDLDAIRETVSRLPALQVLVVGPVADPAVVEQLRRTPRVDVREPLSRKQIAGLVHAADVCILPHVRSPLTEAMSPLKVYEYCSAGRPVAATDLPPIRGIHPNVHLAEAGSPAAFAEAVACALAAGPMTEPDREAFVAANGWEQRFEQLLDLAFA